TKKPQVIMPNKLGTYEGTFSFNIKGYKFSEKVNGVIPIANNELKDKNPQEDIIESINHLIHDVLKSELLSKELVIIENNINASVHPFTRLVFVANKQIQGFIKSEKGGVTPEIIKLAYVANNINSLKQASVKGIDHLLARFISQDYKQYYPTNLALNIASALLKNKHSVAFCESNNISNPMILVSNGNDNVEVVCVYARDRESSADTEYINYLIQKVKEAKTSFSNNNASLIELEINEHHFDKFRKDNTILKKYFDDLLKKDNTVSAILLVCPKYIAKDRSHLYSQEVIGRENHDAKNKLPNWFKHDLVKQRLSDFSTSFYIRFNSNENQTNK
ncbi:hypothetical protein ACFL57_03060, partial [Candidatus Margulisiibacteriota bacterium]